MELESTNTLRKNFGHLKCYWFKKGVPIIVIGPHWPLFMCFFTILLLLGVFLVFYASPKVSLLSSFIGFIIFSFLLVSYFCAAMLNPGIEMNKCQDDDFSVVGSSSYCNICDVYTRPGTEHCKDCEVCIVEYDHHCPWTSKCIGKGNLMFFYMFLASLLVCFIYGIFTMAMQPKLARQSE